MNFKEIIQLFIPPMYYKVKHLLCPQKQTELCPLPKIERQGDRMVVIGNGPSLNKTIELYESQLHEADSVMVNFSAKSELFERIKPSAYLLVDPAYYTIPKHLETSLLALYGAIVTKTTWPMKIVMPKCAKGCYAVERFKENPNLELLFYEDGWQLPNGISKYEAWDKNLICPPAQTVLNTAVWLSVYWGYKETYLVGADTSFIQDIYVGQKDNILYTVDTHFYKNEDVYKGELEPEKSGRKFGMDMEQLLESVYVMFKSYRELREYAEWKGVKIYNASEYSMIDCLERKKLNV